MRCLSVKAEYQKDGQCGRRGGLSHSWVTLPHLEKMQSSLERHEIFPGAHWVKIGGPLNFLRPPPTFFYKCLEHDYCKLHNPSRMIK